MLSKWDMLTWDPPYENEVSLTTDGVVLKKTISIFTELIMLCLFKVDLCSYLWYKASLMSNYLVPAYFEEDVCL